MPRDLAASGLVKLGYYEAAEVHMFRRIYKSVGRNREPFERQNYERFYTVLELMRQHNLKRVFLLDSDVVLLEAVFADLFDQRCDLVASMGPAKTWQSMHWALWAGTAMLRRDVLQKFVAFVPQMFSPGKTQVLVTKKRWKKPYVCDMTAWYLFASWATKGGGLDRVPRYMLPKQRAMRYQLCDSAAYGFDHMHAHKAHPFLDHMEYNSKYHIDCMRMLPTSHGPHLKSVHYQGAEKKWIHALQGRMQFNLSNSNSLAAIGINSAHKRIK